MHITCRGLIASVLLLQLYVPPVASPVEAPLTVQVALEQRDFAVLEPVLLTLTLSNRTAEPILVVRPRAGITLTLGVTTDGAALKPREGESWPAVLPCGTIGPQQQRHLTVNLLEHFDMRRAGTYAVAVTYGRPKGTRTAVRTALPVAPVTCETLKLSVRRPTARESNAIDWVDDSEGVFPARRYWVAAGPIALLYQDTAYGKYAYYWLGCAKEASFHREEALYCFERFLKQSPRSPLVEDVKYRIFVLKRKLGRVKDLPRSFQRLLEESRDMGVRGHIERDLMLLRNR